MLKMTFPLKTIMILPKMMFNIATSMTIYLRRCQVNCTRVAESIPIFDNLQYDRVDVNPTEVYNVDDLVGEGSDEFVVDDEVEFEDDTLDEYEDDEDDNNVLVDSDSDSDVHNDVVVSDDEDSDM